MQEPVLKAVAMPPRVFWAPMIPAVVNLVLQGVFILMWVATGHNPIIFIGTIAIAHIGIIIYGVREPHLSNMMRSYGPFLGASKNVYRTRGKKYAP